MTAPAGRVASILDPSSLEHRSIRRALSEVQGYFRGRLLDLGCGGQPYRYLADFNRCRYVGVDLALDHASLPDACADSLRLPFKDNTFDTVLSTQVIEHVTDPSAMVQEASRVLRPDGYLVLTAPQAWPLHEEPRDFFRYTRYGLQLLAERHHLKVVLLRERGGGLLALAQLLDVLLYDKVGRRVWTRIPFKLLFLPIIATIALLDRILFLPKFTLGYVMVAQKSQ